MPPYRSPDGRWRYRARITTPSGKSVRISGSAPIKQNTQAAAVGAERAHIARLLNPSTANATGKDVPTFGEFATRYMREVAPSQSKSERDGKRWKLDSLLLPKMGARTLDEIGSAAIAEIRAHLIAEDRAPSTVNNYLATIGAILSYAVELELLDKVPRLGLLKIEDQPFDRLTDAEYDALLNAATDPMLRCAVLLGADAGLRAGEIRALHRADVGAKLHVIRSDYNGELKATKGKRARTVNMTERLREAIEICKRAHLGPRVLARPDGAPWTKEVMRWNMPKLCTAAGLREIGWHTLRHTFCSRLAERGVPAAVIQRLAGHTSITTTERYMHLAPDAGDQWIGVLEENAGQNVAKKEKRP